MADLAYSLCTPWLEVDDVRGCSDCDDAVLDMDDAAIEQVIAFASFVLYQATGRQWPGECEVEDERPCGPHGYVTCTCPDLRAWRLSGYPVVVDSVVVTVDGVVLDPSGYALVNRRYLVRLTDPDSGVRGTWPCCQRLDLPPSELGTSAVSYRYGTLPPDGYQLPALMLVREYALACQPGRSGACEIPANVQSLVMQGVSVQLPDPSSVLTAGLTGVRLVDQWLTAIRYGQAHRRSSVHRPHWAGSKQLT